uniref:Uncharacterized protein n=1 Tax=Steinernema glaseri TaxID=37863 RepID=A0A1I8ALP8_9BILA
MLPRGDGLISCFERRRSSMNMRAPSGSSPRSAVTPRKNLRGQTSRNGDGGDPFRTVSNLPRSRAVCLRDSIKHGQGGEEVTGDMTSPTNPPGASFPAHHRPIFGLSGFGVPPVLGRSSCFQLDQSP